MNSDGHVGYIAGLELITACLSGFGKRAKGVNRVLKALKIDRRSYLLRCILGMYAYFTLLIKPKRSFCMYCAFLYLISDFVLATNPQVFALAFPQYIGVTFIHMP